VINFCSDNVAGAPDEIISAVSNAARGAEPAFDGDAWTRRLRDSLTNLFERPVELFLVPSGTAANALAVSCLVPADGIVFCHQVAHVQQNECGAVEFYSGGATLHLLGGRDGKIDPRQLEDHVSRLRPGSGRTAAAALTITQATETGTVYALDELAALCDCAHAHDIKVHMDGARFANALVRLECSPADMTWRAGIDTLSFGCTKNGTIGVDAVLSFDPMLAEPLRYRRKRGGLFMSKSRFLSAQMEAYLANDLWLRNARHANAMAQLLAGGFAGLPDIVSRYPIEANEVFVELPERVIEGLLADGFRFVRWGGEVSRLVRLVTSFATSPDEVQAFVQAARRRLEHPPS
jgi:threonine aldolase